MAFPFRQPRVARDAIFSAPDPNRDLPVYDGPDAINKRINSLLRRRLSDRLETLFQATCVSGDLETAADLLTVLENEHKRGREKLGSERRAGEDVVARYRAELIARQARAISQ